MCVVYIIYIRVAGRVKVTEELNPGDSRNLEFFLFLVICTTKEKRIVKNANCLRGESPSSDIKIREHTHENVALENKSGRFIHHLKKKNFKL